MNTVDYSTFSRNYAINWNSFSKDNRSYTVDALCYYERHGQRYVTSSILEHITEDDLTLEEFQEVLDKTQGGWKIATWDGEYLITPSQEKLSTLVKLAEGLNPLWENFAVIPEGYTGWYRLNITGN